MTDTISKTKEENKMESQSERIRFARKVGKLPKWETSREFKPMTATVFSQRDVQEESKDRETKGIWKAKQQGQDWEPQDVLIYPTTAELDVTKPHGFWATDPSAEADKNGHWKASDIWFYPPGAISDKDIVPRGKWAYPPQALDISWPPQQIKQTKKERSVGKLRIPTAFSSTNQEIPATSTSSFPTFPTPRSRLSLPSSPAKETTKKVDDPVKQDNPSLDTEARSSNEGQKPRTLNSFLSTPLPEPRQSLSLSSFTTSPASATTDTVGQSIGQDTREEQPKHGIASPQTSCRFSKMDLVQRILSKSGSLIVLCTQCPDEQACQDQDDAIIFCHKSKIPSYRVIIMEEYKEVSKRLLDISGRAVFPQFFFQSENKKYERIFLGGFATIKVMVTERTSYQNKLKNGDEKKGEKGNSRRYSRTNPSSWRSTGTPLNTKNLADSLGNSRRTSIPHLATKISGNAIERSRQRRRSQQIKVLREELLATTLSDEISL
jgi:hypothetical protein